MRASITMVMEAAYAAWAARDLEAVLACFAKDVTFIIHLPPDIAPYMGAVQGKRRVGERLRQVLDDFDFLEYAPIGIRAAGNISYSRVRFHYRHKATGLAYEGTMRHVWRIEGDRVMRFEEFHDAERVRTFFKLLEQARRG